MASVDEISFAYATPAGIIAAAVILPSIGMTLVSLRFYVRSQQSARIGVDDWLSVAGLLTIIGMSITMLIGVANYAMGYPTPAPPNDDMDTILNFNPPETELLEQLEFALLIISSIGLSCIKASIVMFYRRLFVTQRRSPFDILSWMLLGIIGLWSVTYVFGWIFGCGSHVSANWGSLEQLSLYCTASIGGITNSFMISDLIVDVLVLVLPLPVIWNLKMPIIRKLAISGIFLIGMAAIAFSIARLVLSFEITAAGFTASVDENLTVSTILYWFLIEAGIAHIASCLPTLRFLFRNHSLQTVMNSFRSALPIRSQSPSSLSSGISGELGKVETTVTHGGHDGTLTHGLPALRSDSVVRVVHEVKQTSESV